MTEQDSEGTVVLEPPPREAKERKTEREKAPPRKQPPYAVIVENDDFHTFDYVIEVLQKVFGYDLQKAFLLTSLVHNAGQALVWSGALELAELKRDQIKGFGPDRYGSKPVTFPLGARVEPLAG